MIKVVLKKFKKLIRLFNANVLVPILLALTYPLRASREKKFHTTPPPRTVLLSYFARGLGDCLYFSGLLKAIRLQFPAAKIQLAILAQMEIYFRENPYIDELIPCPDYYDSLQENLRYLRSALRHRKTGSIDLLLNFFPTLALEPVFWDVLIKKRYSIGIGDSIKRVFYDTSIPINWGKHYYESIPSGLHRTPWVCRECWRCEQGPSYYRQPSGHIV